MASPKTLKLAFAIIGLAVILLVLGLNFNLSESIGHATFLDGIQNSVFDALGGEGAKELKLSPRDICKCPPLKSERLESGNASQGTTQSPTKLSACSSEATAAGPDQLVIAYSFYMGNRARDYPSDLKQILESSRKYYPEWLVRLYASEIHIDKFCDSICAHQDMLFYCPIEHVDLESFGNVSEGLPRQWRFLPLGDPTVTRFISRDLDSRPGQRERDAVAVWESSSYPFHAMRDHIAHKTPILAGMWGADNQRLKSAQAAQLQKQLVYARKEGGFGDQDALKEILYVPYRKSILIHDSYHCQTFKDGLPFPTRRVDLKDFVGKPIGSAFYDVPVIECPVACRPQAYKSWKFC